MKDKTIFLKYGLTVTYILGNINGMTNDLSIAIIIFIVFVLYVSFAVFWSIYET